MVYSIEHISYNQIERFEGEADRAICVFCDGF